MTDFDDTVECRPASRADWQAVLAKATAFLALREAGLQEEDLVVRGRFLMSLGVPRRDAASMLGSTDESLRVSLAKAMKKGGFDGKKARRGN